MTYTCSHCHTEIPARGYTCPRCGRISREKVAAASAKPKGMIVPPPAGAKKKARATPDAARGQTESASPPPEESRQGRAEKRHAGDEREKSGKTARESREARKAQDDLWAGLSAKAEMPAVPSPLDAAGPSRVAPARFVESPAPDVAAGATDVLNLRPGVRVEGAQIVESTRHLSPSFDLGAYKLDLSFLAQAAPSAVFAPVTPRDPLAPGDFPGLLRERLSRLRGPVTRAAGPKLRVALVACTCPGMNRFLADLAGEDPEALLVVRSPGGIATDRNGALPGLVSAVAAYGCVEIALLTHDGCLLERLLASDVVKLLAASGHHREDFPGDPREAACAFDRAEEALAASVGFLERRSEFSGVPVHGLHLQEGGKLKVVVDGSGRFAIRAAATEGKRA